MTAMRLSRTILVLTAGISAACRSSGAQLQAPAVTALTHATVLDGTGTAPRTDMTILIENGRIRDVRPSALGVPPGAAVTDLTGRFVIPGLIDAHVHLGTQPRPEGVMEAVLRASFLGGVTSVRDMGGQYQIVHPLAKLGGVDSIPMPRVAYAAIVAGRGMWLDGDRARFFSGGLPPGEAPTVRRLLDATDVAAAVASAKASGATGIKIYNAIDPALVRAVAAEARRAGLRVWSHLFVDPGTASEVVDAGAEVVSHADMFVSEILPASVRAGPVPEYRVARHAAYVDTSTMRSESVQKLIATMRSRGTILDPTLYVMRPGPDSAGRIDERRAALFHAAVEFVRSAHRAGVAVAAGTDGLGGSSPNLHVELQLLVDSVGMSPVEAIRAATQVSARALGMSDSLGTLERGKKADLVILSADPSVDIANTMTVVAVMKAGRLHHRERRMTVPPGARAPKTAP